MKPCCVSDQVRAHTHITPLFSFSIDQPEIWLFEVSVCSVAFKCSYSQNQYIMQFKEAGQVLEGKIYVMKAELLVS